MATLPQQIAGLRFDLALSLLASYIAVPFSLPDEDTQS